MRVSPPPPCVPRLIVTNSRNVFRRPIVEPRPLALVLQVLRRQADRRHREDPRVVADLGPSFDHGRGADAAPPADRHVRADGAVRADGCSLADARRRMHAARSDRRARRPGPPPAAVPPRRPADRRQTPPRALSPAATGFVPAAPRAARGHPARPCCRNFALFTPRSQTREVAGALAALEDQDGRHLGQRLDHEHAGHQWRARKVTLEELLVDGDVLVRDQPVAGLVLGHRVDQQRRIAVVDAVEERWEVNRHGRIVHASRFSVLGSCSGSVLVRVQFAVRFDVRGSGFYVVRCRRREQQPNRTEPGTRNRPQNPRTLEPTNRELNPAPEHEPRSEKREA